MLFLFLFFYLWKLVVIVLINPSEWGWMIFFILVCEITQSHLKAEYSTIELATHLLFYCFTKFLVIDNVRKTNLHFIIWNKKSNCQYETVSNPI
jgi:hypothetical protein